MNDKIKAKDILRIDEILQSKNLSKTDFADRLGVNRQTLYSFLNRNITLETILKISETLEVAPWQLFTDSQTAGTDGKLYGVVVFDGTPYRIQSVEDLEKLLDLAKA